MLHQMLSLYRDLTESCRTITVSRRPVLLAAISLEERATPAVSDGFAPPMAVPETVQFAPLSQEARVRADLFGVGDAGTAIEHVNEMAWLEDFMPPIEVAQIQQPLWPSELELDLATASANE